MAAKALTKSELIGRIAESTSLTKKQIASVFEALSREIGKAVSKKGAGAFTLPGLMKITIVEKPATKARKGINPFTKEETVFKAKPAQRVVKVRALKALKDMTK
jgi:nucleoid DNA-binding protein